MNPGNCLIRSTVQESNANIVQENKNKINLLLPTYHIQNGWIFTGMLKYSQDSVLWKFAIFREVITHFNWQTWYTILVFADSSMGARVLNTTYDKLNMLVLSHLLINKITATSSIPWVSQAIVIPYFMITGPQGY